MTKSIPVPKPVICSFKDVFLQAPDFFPLKIFVESHVFSEYFLDCYILIIFTISFHSWFSTD